MILLFWCFCLMKCYEIGPDVDFSPFTSLAAEALKNGTNVTECNVSTHLAQSCDSECRIMPETFDITLYDQFPEHYICENNTNLTNCYILRCQNRSNQTSMNISQSNSSRNDTNLYLCAKCHLNAKDVMKIQTILHNKALIYLRGKSHLDWDLTVKQSKDHANGPPGLPGPRGEQGRDGEDGQPGKRGETGPMGDDGNPGVCGVCPKCATIGRDGDPGNKGMKGDPGEKGPKGECINICPICEKPEMGPPGPVGLPGDDGEHFDFAIGIDKDTANKNVLKYSKLPVALIMSLMVSNFLSIAIIFIFLLNNKKQKTPVKSSLHL